MSFLSDLFKGNFSNLGNDLSPSNFFSDTSKDFKSQPSWLQDIELAAPAAIATVATAGADLPALGGLFGADATLSAADAATASTLPDWLGTTSFGGTLDAAAGTGSAALPATATLDAGTSALSTASSGGWPTSLDVGGTLGTG